MVSFLKTITYYLPFLYINSVIELLKVYYCQFDSVAYITRLEYYLKAIVLVASVDTAINFCSSLDFSGFIVMVFVYSVEDSAFYCRDVGFLEGVVRVGNF